MKKKFAFILVMAMLLTLAACGIAQEETQSRSLYAHGLDMVEMLCEMAESENYIGIYTANSEIAEIILELGKGNYDTPKSVFAVTVPEDTLTQMAEVNNLENASENLKQYLMSRTLASLVSQLNAMSGVEKLAATSVCTVGKSFVSENAIQDVIYLYVYENAEPVAVTFTLGEDHTVSATGTFLLYEDCSWSSAEEVQNIFSDIMVNVSEVNPEK